MRSKLRVVIADTVTEEFAHRWRDDLSGLKIDLVMTKDESDEALKEVAVGSQIIITRNRPIDDVLLEAAGKEMKLVVKLSHWPLDIDIQALNRRGITLKLFPQSGCIAVAEQAMALLLACARQLIPSHSGVVDGSYKKLGLSPAVTTERSFAFKWLPVKPFEVYGKTLGIIGLGEIGKEMAVRARSFDMEVLYNKRTHLPQEFEETLDVRFCSLNELLRSSDFVSLHVPHTEETDKLLGKAEFQVMKSTAYLINTARGGEVDEEALVWALKSREIAGAGLDVFREEPLPLDHPLLQLDNVVLSPHIGGGSGTGRAALTEELRTLISNAL